MKEYLVGIADWVPYLWRRLHCLFTDHTLVAGVKWSPEGVCMGIFCEHCGKALGHLDIATPNAKKGSIH